MFDSDWRPHWNLRNGVYLSASVYWNLNKSDIQVFISKTDNKNCKQVFFFSKFAAKTTFQALCGNSYVPLDLYLQSVLFRPRKGFDVTLLHKIE